ncbi:uncharacterized protein [Rutidosis leptorrhynchoides]|uniref:uncharacterized protein n=1 Tax=Rutidosis leptorrhynchoides TaxID=125765 RepID=UPI003A99F1BA
MAPLSSSSLSSNSWILSLKTLLITVGIISIAVTIKLAIPLIVNFAVNDLHAVWSVTVSWLKPPFLYVIINGIILIIVASTHFQHNNNHENQNESLHQDVNVNLLNAPSVNFGVPDNDTERIAMVEPPVVYETKRVVADIIDVDETEVVNRFEDDLVTSASTWHPSETVINDTQLTNNIEPDFEFPVREKQLVASRFVNNRKPPTKINRGGGRELRVLKPKKHETLESTWKMITEGRSMPLNRHVDKSETFKTLKNDRDRNEFTSAVKVVKKSETFKDRKNYENENQYLQNNLPKAESIEKLKSEASDELNRRVEAFIKKFNDDMRLQRQESLDQYMKMVKHGVIN